MTALAPKFRGARVFGAAGSIALALMACSDSKPLLPLTSASASPSGTARPGTRVVFDGIAFEVPAGWKYTKLTPADQAAARARETDPETVKFLRERMRGLSTDPSQVARDNVAPKLRQAGFAPETGSAELPAGHAITLTTRYANQGLSFENQVVLLVLGRSVVGLSMTYRVGASEEIPRILESLQLG